MKERQFTKEEILGMVNLESARGRDVCFEIENLRLHFGFKRMDGEEIMLRKLISTKSEEQMQTLQPYELMENFELWCRQVGIIYGYDFITHRYFLRKN
jgi:hypothetical protein